MIKKNLFKLTVIVFVMAAFLCTTNYSEAAASKPQYRRAAAENLCKANQTSEIKGTYGKKNFVSYAYDKIRRAKKYTAHTKKAKKAIYQAVQFLGKRKFDPIKADKMINEALYELMLDGVDCIKGEKGSTMCINDCKRK